MTAQIPDRFTYHGDKYDLVGIEGEELVSPEQFGIEPETISTACYRGFYATYELTENGLYLRQLTLAESNGKYVPIDGVEPELQEYQATYHNLNVYVNFTGKIRLAKDLIKELYVHMGFQKPTAYKTVLDLTLEDGEVVEVLDRSAEVEKKRGDFKRRYDSGDFLDRIDEAFSLDMDLK